MNLRGGKRTERNETGGSLVEILVACVVIGILVVMAVPGGIRELQLYRLNSSAALISNKVMEARMAAIKRNRTSLVRLSATDRMAQVRSTDNAGTPVDVGHPQPLSGQVSLDPNTSVDISFDSMGRLAAGAGQTTITLVEVGSGRRKDVVISPAGRVSVGSMY